MRLGLLPLAATLLLTTVPVFAQYRWLDDDGRVNYGDQPPSDAKGLIRINAAGPARGDAASSLPFELRRAMARYPVALYTAEGCAPCDLARVYLRRRGVPYQEIVVETDEEAAEMKRRVGVDAVPVMTLGRAPNIGFNEAQWSSALDAATYPSQSQLPLTFRFEPPQPLVPRAAGPVSAVNASASEPAPR